MPELTFSLASSLTWGLVCADMVPPGGALQKGLREKRARDNALPSRLSQMYTAGNTLSGRYK